MLRQVDQHDPRRERDDCVSTLIEYEVVGVVMFCVYCGAHIGNETACGNCGAHKAGSTWHPADSPTTAVAHQVPYNDTSVHDTGWRPDPTGRHEGRYFVAGQPTDLIRDGTTESLDSSGKRQLPEDIVAYPHVEPPSPSGSKSRRVWLVAAIAAVALALAGIGVGATLFLNRDRESLDDKYLAALHDADLAAEFNSDANAIAHAKQTCRQLEEGGRQQGMPVDKVAVDSYCPKFSDGFHVLETATITGSFTLTVDSPDSYFPAITTRGSSCSGADGYSDIDQGTVVTIKNGKGDILTSTSLGVGTGSSYECTFPFSFEITEGDDRYVVSVGRRGELSYTFDELRDNGVTLNLGN
jgi:hypothetical protein